MNTELSRSEILEAAQKIRESDEKILTPEQAQILADADRISLERRSSGIAGVVDSVLDVFRSDRQKAEAALERARGKEAEVEKLLADRSGLQAEVARAESTLERVKNLARFAQEQGQPTALEAVWQSKTWALGESNFYAHAALAAQEVSTRRELANGFEFYVKAAAAALEAAQQRLATIERQLQKARK